MTAAPAAEAEDGAPLMPSATPTAAPAAVAVPGGSALLETDAALIKAMHDLGPAIKTLRLVRVCARLVRHLHA